MNAGFFYFHPTKLMNNRQPYIISWAKTHDFQKEVSKFASGFMNQTINQK